MTSCGNGSSADAAADGGGDEQVDRGTAGYDPLHSVWSIESTLLEKTQLDFTITGGGFATLPRP